MLKIRALQLLTSLSIKLVQTIYSLKLSLVKIAAPSILDIIINGVANYIEGNSGFAP